MSSKARPAEVFVCNDVNCSCHKAFITMKKTNSQAKMGNNNAQMINGLKYLFNP